MSRFHRAAAAATFLLVAGCGIPAEPQARKISPPPGAFPGIVQAPDDLPSAGQAQTRLYMVRDRALVRVTRRAAEQPTVASLVRDLQAGPTLTERNDGLSSALPGTGVITGVRQVGRRAEVALGTALDTSGRSDEVVAFAQVVCTLTTHGDVDGVFFVRDGRRVAVPRADGSLSEGPLSTADYRELIVPS
jgi:hypothetical protein